MPCDERSEEDQSKNLEREAGKRQNQRHFGAAGAKYAGHWTSALSRAHSTMTFYRYFVDILMAGDNLLFRTTS
jgi:hypothetical protein